MGCCCSTNGTTNNELNSCTMKNTTRFSFDGLCTIAKVIKVYDGDTITVAFQYHNQIYKLACRMRYYDTPEMKPKLKPGETLEDYKYEIELAHCAQRVLSNAIYDRIVKVTFGKFGRYGRALTVVECDNININDMMLKLPYVRPYTGGTKEEIDYEPLAKANRGLPLANPIASDDFFDMSKNNDPTRQPKPRKPKPRKLRKKNTKYKK